MVNSILLKNVADIFKLDLNVEKIPQPIAIVKANPYGSALLFSANKITTGNLDITATNLDSINKDFYLTGINYDMIKDATCDKATGELLISITPSDTGVLTNIISIPVIVTTAQSIGKYIHFETPIKINKNTSILFTGTYTAGLMSRSLSIYGFRNEIN